MGVVCGVFGRVDGAKGDVMLRERLVRRAKVLDAISAAKESGCGDETMRSIESAILDVELMDLAAACRLDEIVHQGA